MFIMITFTPKIILPNISLLHTSLRKQTRKNTILSLEPSDEVSSANVEIPLLFPEAHSIGTSPPLFSEEPSSLFTLISLSLVIDPSEFTCSLMHT